MTAAEMERFATEPGVAKVSSRDIPVVLATGGRTAAANAAVLVSNAEVAGHLVAAQARYRAQARAGTRAETLVET